MAIKKVVKTEVTWSSRGASLPIEAVELGFWAVVATASGSEGDQVESAAVEAFGNHVRQSIEERYRPGADRLLRLALSLRDQVRGGRSVKISSAAYERTRIEIAAKNQVQLTAGQAAWPPGNQTVAARFGGGSWSEALGHFGVAPSGGGRTRGRNTLPDEDFTRALRAFQAHCEEQGSALTHAGYGRWVKEERAEGRPRPAAATMRQRFGTWAGALEAAGLK
ncbi:hypothetical protein [Actinomyces minihominis]|uniref:hypothetical protein n=1 Tax=Actinomyces minihominis TaxID=2002838 RepID=UPI000C0763BE|nr:hypothetical protein [Actinomyces minihominis]